MKFVPLLKTPGCSRVRKNAGFRNAISRILANAGTTPALDYGLDNELNS